MFGSELALGDVSLLGKLHYKLLGHDHVGLRVRARHVQKALAGLGVPADILDAGSGDGSYTFYFARRYPQARLIGIELRPELIANARQIATGLGLGNVEFVQADLTDYEPAGQFDLVCCVDVLEHILDDEGVLRSFRRHLRPRGCLLLHVPARRRTHLFRRFETAVIDDHVRDGYDRDELDGKLRRAGFAVIELRPTFGRFGSLASELSTVLEGVRMGRYLRPALFPFLMLIACLDTVTANREHQGILVRAVAST